MADEPTGTPLSPVADGAATASGTTTADGAGGAGSEDASALKARIAELESQRKQDLARLTSGEEARRELELMRERAATTPPAGYDPQTHQAQQQIADVWRRAYEGEPEAVAQLVAAGYQATRAEIEQARAETRWYRELDAVPAEYRQAVEQRARRDGVAPSTALAFVKAERLDQKERELAEQSRKLQEERDRLSRGVVSTTASPSHQAPSTSDFTQAEYAQTARAAVYDPAMRKRLAEMDQARMSGKGFRPG